MTYIGPGMPLRFGPLQGGAAFTPTDISGLVLWVKADALVLSNNDPVASWTDSGGAGHPLLQATGANQPLYKTGQVNSLPAVEFDGTSDFLQAAFTLAHPVTVFLAVNQVSWATNDRIHEGVTGASTLRLIQVTGSPQLRMDGSGTGTAQNGPAIGAWGLVTEVFNGASSTYALNGGGDVAINLTSLVGTVGGVTLGASNAASAFANIRVAEFLLYDSVLSGANQALVKAYLNSKYVLY
jgi:hypothetical protein